MGGGNMLVKWISMYLERWFCLVRQRIKGGRGWRDIMKGKKKKGVK